MNINKKVLFVINNMEYGGTRSSLLNLLSNLSSLQLTIDLLVLSPFGPLMDSLPTSINLIEPSPLIKCSYSNKQYLNSLEKLLKAFLKLCRMIFGYDKLYTLIFKRFARKVMHYDAVIGFQEGESNDCAAFLTAGTNIGWIHNDYYNFQGNSKGIPASYEKMDKIVFVADSSLRSFLDYYPEYEYKCCIIRNTIDTNRILRMAKLPEVNYYKDNIIRLLSVGRLSEQKRFDRVISIAAILNNQFDFQWIVLGDGEKKEELIELVNSNNLDDCVSFIGSSKNPFSYMANADLLIVTSDYEAQPMVILESLTVGTPVVSTNYDSAVEIKEITGDSMVLTNKNASDIAETIINILQNRELKHMQQTAKSFIYDNDKIIMELLHLID